MFESIINFFKKIGKQDKNQVKSKDAAKERLHLVLMQDRANVSADFLDLMKQEIIEVIKKYIDVDENAIDVRLTNKANNDGTTGAPALYANIPIMSIKEEVKSGMSRQKDSSEQKNEDNKDKKKAEKTKVEEVEAEVKEDKKNEKSEKAEVKEDNKENKENVKKEDAIEDNKEDAKKKIEKEPKSKDTANK